MSELQRQSIAAWIDERRRNNTSYGITPRNDAAESPRDFTASVPAGTSMVQTDAGDIIPMPGADHAATERKNAEPENIDGGADLTNPAARNLYQQTADPGRIVPPSGNFGSVDDNHLFAPQPGITEAVRSITPKDILENQLKRWNENDSDENLARVIQTLGTEGGRKAFDEMQGNRADIEQARRELDEEVRKRKPGWDAQYQENRKKNDHWTNTLMGYSGQAAIDDANISREEKDFNLASRLLDAAQYRAETVSRLEQEIAEATGNEKSGSTQRFMHGLKPETLNNLLTAGWGETADLLRVSQIADKAARGEQLTDGEKQAAGAYVLSLDAASRLENLGGATWMEKAGQMIGDNMPFLLEMAITGGFGGAAAGAARGLMRKGIAAGVRAGLRNRAGRYVAKQGANLLGAMVGGAATAPFSNATWGDFAQRNVDQYDISQGVNGEIEAVESRPESLVSRVAKSLGTGTAELGSEYWGGFAGAGRLFPQALRGTRVARITEPLRRLAYTPSVQRLDRYVGNIFKWDGLPMEYAEEQLNNIIGPLMAGEPERIRENFSSEAQLETLLGVVAMGGVFQTIGTGAAAYDHVQSRRRSAGLLGYIQNPDIRQQVARAMGHFTQQQQAKAISNIDWDNASLHDMAATTDYIMHRTQGRVAQEMQRAMQEQQEAKMATLQFEQFKNRDTGQLEEVFDTQGNRFYLAGGTIERSGEETADGTVFVVDPVSGEVSQKSIDELKRGTTTPYEAYEQEALERIRTVSQAQAEAEAVEEIMQEADATHSDPMPMIADYKGIDLSTLSGKTVTLRDGSTAFVNSVTANGNDFTEIDIVPLDPATGMTRTGENGEEIHRLLNVADVTAVDGVPVGPETVAAQTTPSEGEGVASQTPELQNGQQGTLDDGEQTNIDPAQGGAIDGTPVGTQNAGTPPVQTQTAQLTTQQPAANTVERDENNLPFVKASDGTEVFGEIHEESGLPGAPIKLSEGFQDETGKGYGLAHIEANHGEQIRNAGFPSVIDFVSFVATNYDEGNIRVGKRRYDGSTTYLLQVTDEHDNTLFVELSKDGSYWNVNSAGIFRKGYSNKKETVAKTEPRQPNNAVSTGSSLSEAGHEGITSSEPNGKPTVSNIKDTNSVPSEQEIPRKKDGTPDYGSMEPNAMFRAIAEDFGEDVAREQVAQQISIYEGKIKKLSNSRSENINTRLENLTKIKELQEKVNALCEAAGIFEEETAETVPKTKTEYGRRATLREQSRALGDYLSVEDKILRDIAEGLKFRWNDNGAQRGLGTELGFSDSPAERKARFNILSNDGTTVDRYAESLEHDMDRGVIPMAMDADMRSAILDVLSRVRSNREAFDAAMALREDDPRSSMTEEEARLQAEYNASRASVVPEVQQEETKPVENTTEQVESPAEQEAGMDAQVPDFPFRRSEAEGEAIGLDFSPEHRQAVEEIVEELNQELGENVVVFAELEELPEKVRDDVRKAMEDGYMVQGLTFNHVCYLYAPAITDKQTADYVYTHELAGHKNVEAAFSDRTSFAAFCDRLVDDIGVSEMAENIDDTGFMDCVNAYFANPDARNKYALGREYIAYLTENSNAGDLYEADYEGDFSLPSYREFITTDTLNDLIHYANSRQGRGVSQGQGRMGEQTETETGYRRADGTAGLGTSNADRLSGGGQTADSGRSRPDGVPGSGTDHALPNAAGNIPGRASADEGGNGSVGSRGTGAEEHQGSVSGQDDTGVDRDQSGTLPAGETVTQDDGPATGNDDIRFRRTEQQSESSAYEAEIQSIIDQAKADGTYLKAPNGKPTRLSERQWAQVRTRAFKNWFGDWEKAARLRLIDALNPISVDGNPSIEQREAEAVFSHLENGKNRYDGREVVWVKNSVGKIMRHKGFDTSRLIPAIKDVFDASVPILSEAEERKPGHKEHSNFKGYHHYVGKISLDGRDYYVRFTLQEINTRKKDIVPNQLHSAFVSDVEIMSAGNRVNTGNSPATAETSTPVDVKLQNFIESARTAVENSSKVVDENGEPLVVFHGSSRFNPFEEASGKGVFKPGNDGGIHFGTQEQAEIRGGEGNAHAYFLNIRNPKRTVDRDRHNLQIKEAKKEGYDGTWYNNVFEAPGRSYVAFYPNQIKSATDNTGEFSADNDDIRFRRTQQPQEETASLIAVHNTTEDQLKKSLELGGFPMPSIAITHAEMGHTEFGEISLLFDRTSIDPTNRQNKVYSGDAWTPTFPSVGYKLNEDKTSAIYHRANKVKNLPLFNPVTFHPDNYERHVNGLDTGGLVEHFKDNYDAKQFYLAENGNAVTEYEQHEVEKYPADKIPIYEDVLKRIGVERIVNGDIDSVRDEVREILEQHGIGLSQMKPNVAGVRVNNTIKAALDYAENGNRKAETDIEATKRKIDERIDQQRFEAWLHELFNGVVEKKGIRNDRDAFTPSGNSRKWEALYDEVTLDNIVKAMQRQAARGGQGLFGGSIFGASQKEYPSIDEIREEAKRVIKNISNDEIEAQKNAITDRLSDVKIPGVGSSFSDTMDMAENIKDAVARSHTAKGIYRYLKEFYSGMTMEVAEEIADIVRDIQQMSSRYFEAKPQRAVGFDEVRLAVVPVDTDAELIRQLERRGIAVRTYERGNEEQRREIVANATEELNIRFRRAESATLSPEEVNERFNEELKQQIDGTLPEGHVYRLGMPSEALRSAGVPELPIELSSTRLAEKASADYKSGHPFSLEDMRNLPQALQNPIAVFDSKTRPGSKVILTELTDSQGNNFVAVTRSDIKRVAGRRVIQVNSIRSIYPKDYAQDVVNWINRGDLLKWADKEKTLDWLGKQQSNSADVAIPIQGLDVAANILENLENPTWVDKEKSLDRLRISALLAEAQNNQGQTSGKAAQQSNQEHSSVTNILENFENPTRFDKEKAADFLLVQGPNYLGNGENTGGNVEEGSNLADEKRSSLASATNIIKNFTNPTRADGEKVAAAEEMAAELGVPVRIVRDRSEIGDTESMARDKRGSEGWHDRRSGEIAVVLPNCRDAAEVQKTILHEAVGHYGIPELLGRERADEFYRRVFRSLDDATQARLLAEHGSETVAGDEYLAEMAEGNVTPSVWKRIMAAIRGFFRDVLGIDLKVTDAEMRYILWRSKNNLARVRTVSEAMDTIAQDIRMCAQTEREAARERKAQQLEKLRASEPIQITGEEIKPSEDLKQYKKNALEYGKTLRGEYVNQDSGERISLFAGGKNGGIKEVLQHDYKDPEHLQSVAAIPQIIENSILIDSEQNQDRRVNPDVKQYDYYVVGLKIGDTDYTVKAVVAQDDNGNRYYDHKLTQIEKGTLIDDLYRLSNSVTENQDSPMGLSASSGLSSMVGAGEAEPNIRRPETGNRLQSISPIPDTKDKRLPSILQPALTEIEKGDLIDQRDLVKAQVYDDKAANAVTGTPVATVKDKRLLQILQPEPLKYQQKSEKNAQQEPQTPMQYVDRVAEEMAAQDNEIRFRRKKQQPAADAPIRTTRDNWATRIGRKLQDAHIPVRQLQDYIRAHGGTVGIVNDLYSALNRALGRQMERIRRADAEFAEVARKMRKIKRDYGYKYTQIVDYLAAKSSIERHASGIPAYSDEADAPWNKLTVEKLVADFERTVPAGQVEELWQEIRKITDKQLELMRNYGLISVQTLRDIRDRGWKYYMPLQGVDFDFEQKADPHEIFGEILTERRGGNGLLMHRAKGRTTKPDDVLATLQRNVHLTIMTGEQNLAKQFLLRLAEANPELQGDTRTGQGVFEIEEEWWVRRDPARITPEERERGEVYERTIERPADSEIEQSQLAAAEKRKLEQELETVEKELWKLDVENANNDELSALLDRRRELSEQIQAAFERITAVRMLPRGGHAYRGLSTAEEQMHAVPVYRNGIRTVVRMSDPIVAQAVNGNFKELFGGIMANVVNVIGKGTRWMASTSTSWNPEFLLKNTVRDSLWASFYNWVDKEGDARGYLRNYPVAQRAIVRYHTGKASPLSLNERARYNIYTPEGAAAAIEAFGLSRVRDSWFDDFLMEGGLTGYAYMQEVSDYSKKLARKVRWMSNAAGNTVHGLREAMETMSDLSEVTTRFATFLAQIQKGADIRTAVNYARDITINFNRRGEWGRDLNSLYMFFNAATQGIANFYNLTRRNKARMGFAIAGILGLSYTTSLLLAQFLAADDDDEEWSISDYQRYTNLCLPGWIVGSDDKVVLIPLPQELRPMWVAGTVAADVTGGRIDAKDAWGVFSNATGTVLEAAGEAYLPVEVSLEHPMRTFVPSVFKPFYELYTNADFTGFPIYREPFAQSLEGRIPESQLGMRNANKLISGVTEWLNEKGGGNKWTPAGVDPATGEMNGLINLMDQNPSKIEHLITSYTGGLGRMGARIYRYCSSPDEERVVRDIPFINAFLTDVRKEINPNTEYYDIRQKYESLDYWARNNWKNGEIPPYYNSPEEANRAQQETVIVMGMIKKSEKQLKALKKRMETTDADSPEYRELARQMTEVRRNFINEYDQFIETYDHATEN